MATPEDILYVQTVQVSAFKSLIEVLREVLTDATLFFDDTGIQCTQLDAGYCSVVSVRLVATSFEQFFCPSPVVAGLNLVNLAKLLRSSAQSDFVSLRIRADDVNTLILCIENLDKRQSTTFRVNLLDLDATDIQVPEVAFETVVSLPSGELQRITRDLSLLSDIINISIEGRELVLSASGDFAEQTTRLGERSGGLVYDAGTEPVEGDYGRFLLKYLGLFAKAAVLSPVVNVYLKRDYPLIVNYSVASLGRLGFCLTQQTPAE